MDALSGVRGSRFPSIQADPDRSRHIQADSGCLNCKNSRTLSALSVH